MSTITEAERIIQDLLNAVDDLYVALNEATAKYEYRDIKATAYNKYMDARKFLYERVDSK